MTERTYKLDELARAAGMSARTIRYYVQRGLLAAPAFRGKDTAYGHDHLVRLRAIRRLQEAYFPLDAIAAELEGRSIADVERIAEGSLVPRERHEPSAVTVTTPESAGQRIEIFPGVDLAIADDAPPESVLLVEHLLAILKPMSKGRGRR